MYGVDTSTEHPVPRKRVSVAKTALLAFATMLPIVIGYSYGAKALFGI